MRKEGRKEGSEPATTDRGREKEIGELEESSLAKGLGKTRRIYGAESDGSFGYTYVAWRD